VPNVIERIRANVFGFESAEPLDLVQLHWWDVKVRTRHRKPREMVLNYFLVSIDTTLDRSKDGGIRGRSKSGGP